MTNDTQSGEVARLRAALQEIVDVAQNIPKDILKESLGIQGLYVANRRGDIAVMALADQLQLTGRTDSERLDWLVETGAVVKFYPTANYWSAEAPNDLVKDGYGEGCNFREAIDAAMDSEKEAVLSAMPLPPAPETK